MCFDKMHGLGNDFIVLDCRDTAFDWSREQIAALAKRHTGIGFDQLLIIEPATREADFTYRIFNADGSEVEHCGNGARCFGKYLRDYQLFDFSRPVKVAVKRGLIEIDYQGLAEGIEQFSVDMGVPDFSFFTSQQTSALQQLITVAEQEYAFGIVSMGNPHAVCQVENVVDAPVEEVGRALQQNVLFPDRVNVGFMEVVSRNEIRLRVFERGVGETQACGTGACGAVAVGIARGILNERVFVALPGGRLQIQWKGEGYPLKMSGAAERVFTGKLVL
nr:diaminopimelate epimerase [Suttonella ornithocola]